MPAFDLQVTLRLTGPVLTASTAPGGYGLDAVCARDPMPPAGADGQPIPGSHFILPGSLVRGRLRQAWEELNSVFGEHEKKPFDIGVLLGPDPMNDERHAAGDYNQPKRGRLRFDDFRACPVTESATTRHRIAIDPGTGSADEHMLQLVEAPWGSGADVQFTGTIRCVARNRDEAEELARRVEVGLRWVPQFGGERGLGFGANVGISVTVQSGPNGPSRNRAPEIDNRTTSRALVITPLAPFLLAKHQRIENVFEGDDIISGAAIKGALAEIWREGAGAQPGTPVSEFGRGSRPELAAHFDALMFSHAFPVRRGQRERPVVPPLSLAKTGSRLWDLASIGGPVVLSNQAPGFEAPEFAVDWKSRADVEAVFGWPTLPLPREQRLGTAIDRERNRARDEALFGKECVVPTGHEWLARVDFSIVPGDEARRKVATQLAELLADGLEHLGKTKARATIEVLPAARVTPHITQTLAAQDGHFIVTLQTAALLGWPESLPVFPGVSGAGWKSSYAEVWTELSGGALMLVRHFASQSLAGGGYLWRRFQQHRGCPYNPWLLTDPGSVFVLETVAGPETDPDAFIAAIVARGVPIPEWAKMVYGLSGSSGQDWRSCPYLPENGYGEVAVNLVAHQSLAPRADEFTRLTP
jgi:hypothetical protein